MNLAALLPNGKRGFYGGIEGSFPAFFGAYCSRLG